MCPTLIQPFNPSPGRHAKSVAMEVPGPGVCEELYWRETNPSGGVTVWSSRTTKCQFLNPYICQYGA